MPPSRLIALVLVLAGCAQPTALDLSLVADPNVNSEAALVEKLSCIRLVVDSPDGLYPGGPERREGDLLIKDVDGDGKGELVAGVDVASLGRLPLVRVEQGGLSELPLEFRLDGKGNGGACTDMSTKDPTVAAGGVQGIYFAAGDVVPVQVPFNLRAEYRPPRVTQVYPEDGSSLQPLSLGSVVLIFSKQMDRLSLAKAGVIRLLKVTGTQETDAAIQCVPGEVYSGGPTKVDCKLTTMLEDASYRVRVSQGALDTSGRSLDQVPLQPGNQPFSSQFTLATIAASPACAPGCEMLWCGNGGTAGCPTGLTCTNDACVPEGCPSDCGTLAVCDKTLAACVDDCRIFGTYCGEDRACDQKTGLCTE